MRPFSYTHTLAPSSCTSHSYTHTLYHTHTHIYSTLYTLPPPSVTPLWTRGLTTGIVVNIIPEMCIVNSQRPRVGLMTNWQLGEGGGGVSKRVTADPYSPHSPPPFPPPHRHLENVVHIWHSKRWRRGRGGQEISLFNACGVGARNQAFPRRVSSPLFLYRRNKEVWAEGGGGQRGGKESWCVVYMYNCIYIPIVQCTYGGCRQ